MPIVRHLLSFGAGELSPLLDGRTDLEKYGSGCLHLENFIPMPQGPAMKRPGLQFVGTVRQEDTTDAAGRGRLIEFQVTAYRSVMLAIGGKRMNFIDRGRILKTDMGDDFRLAVPWADAELAELRALQINEVMFLVHPNHPPRVLARINPSTWELVVFNVEEFAPVLEENRRRRHKITATFPVDSDASAWTNGADYETGDRVTFGGKTWVARTDHTATAATDPGDGATFEDADGVGRAIWIESYADNASEAGQRLTLTATANVFKPAHVGGTWELAPRRGHRKYEVNLLASAATSGTTSPVLVVQGDWHLTTFGTWHGDFIVEVSTDQGDTWKTRQVYESRAGRPRNATAEGSERGRVLMRLRYENNAAGTDAASNPYAVLSTPGSRIRAMVKILEYIGPREVKARALTPVEKGSTSFWSEAAWSDHQGWPRCVALHQGRLLMAGTRRSPHTVWGSAVDDFFNFLRGTEPADAFVHLVPVGSRDPILWMQSDRVLVVGNGSSEYTLQGETDDAPITPEYGIPRRQSSFGTHAGGPGVVAADSLALYVANGGRSLRELGYSFQSDSYEGGNLNVLADHLFPGPITDVAIQRQPFQIVWVVARGLLFSLTYEGQRGVVAWARHTVGGSVAAVAVLRRSGEDTVHFLIRRGSRMCIERFVPGSFLNPKNDGSRLDGHTEIVPTYAGYSLAGHPLAGRMVTGYHAGRVVGPAPLDAEFFAGLTKPVKVGLPFRAVLRPMTPEVGLENGSSRGREGRIHGLVVSVHQSRGGMAGPDLTRLDPLGAGNTGGLQTGEIEISLDAGFDLAAGFVLVSEDPHPFTIRNVCIKLNYFGDVR